MYNYLFEDMKTGEQFLVQACDDDNAYEIADEYFDEPICLETVSDYEAEMMGLDTY